MGRAFLVVMDSAGIGGAPDADRYFNDDLPDSGANTLGHIFQRFPDYEGRPLHVPNLRALGLGQALRLASGFEDGVANPPLIGQWGAATEQSRGKDTPSGHWELAGLPVPWDWHYFKDREASFSQPLIDHVCQMAGTSGLLGNCHAPGTAIIDRLGEEHMQTGFPICYTSADSVFQIAAHEESFGLERLIQLCADVAPYLHEMRVGRVIARPFVGSPSKGFARTQNRKDFAIAPPAPVLTNWVQEAGQRVIAIGKIGDIFSMQGIDQLYKGSDAELMAHLHAQVTNAPEGALVFANFVEFDSLFGHRRDVAGYGRALEWFDREIGIALAQMRPGDLLVLCADHGNDPSWPGSDHTRERVPVLVAGRGPGELGHMGFVDVAGMIAGHLQVRPLPDASGGDI
jgi:phosphopentomutase